LTLGSAKEVGSPPNLRSVSAKGSNDAILTLEGEGMDGLLKPLHTHPLLSVVAVNSEIAKVRWLGESACYCCQHGGRKRGGTCAGLNFAPMIIDVKISQLSIEGGRL
jgi:hypothetical protein